MLSSTGNTHLLIPFVAIHNDGIGSILSDISTIVSVVIQACTTSRPDAPSLIIKNPFSIVSTKLIPFLIGMFPSE